MLVVGRGLGSTRAPGPRRPRTCARALTRRLSTPSHPPRRTALVLYRQILDAIEANDYNNFTKRAYVPKWRKLVTLPEALMRANMSSRAA